MGSSALNKKDEHAITGPVRAPAPRSGVGPTALALVVALWAASTSAAELNGPAQVVDGNSLAVGGRVVRLFGIDAPDEDQVCHRQGTAWRCGQDAGWALAERLERHWVLCDTRATPASAAAAADPTAPDADAAVCYLDGRRIDVNAWMVEQGWALADRRANLYVTQEDAAQRAGRGLWSGTFDPPWVWRERKR